ncbi:hypothetical protein [Moheibacter stercoris]|uniref:Microsomal dipeptidase-like Zn-dependent dipeptidase n=1 Tax=Moheibacter stercoris TaxID=1628251 RepID=A0ABV2LUB7_9FLAO
MSTQFFDFHFHPLFKKFITQYEAHFPTQRKTYELEARIELKNFIADKVDDWFLHILQSQSALNDCVRGGTKLGVAALANLEFGFADSKGMFASILKSNFTKPMDRKYFDMVQKGEISYYRMMLKELDLYRAVSKQNPEIQMLTRKKHQTIYDSKAKLNLLVSLEGAHNLFRLKIGQTIQHDSAAVFSAYDQKDSFTKSMNEGPKIGINPVQSLQNFMQLLWDNDMDMLYMTVTHLTHVSEQNLATHGFGMKMLKHPSFYPAGNGLTSLGKEFIKALGDLKLTNEKGEKISAPVLVDLKHLGLKSRQDLYQFRKDNKIELPLVASHIGVTGYSTNEWKQELKPNSAKIYNYQGVRSVEIEMERKSCGKWGSFVNQNFSFNPWSINLMDDDIVKVLESNGLIGVSLDVRILGFQAQIGLNTGDASEYISTADFQTHFPHINLQNLPVEKLETMAIQEESWLIPTKEDRHPLCFCFNIIHIVTVGYLRGPEGINPWNHISVGSDYDGLIEPMKICHNIQSIDDLEYNLLKWLPTAAKAYYDENGGVEFLQHELKNLTYLKSIVKKIMYENGERFVNNWLKGQPGASE